MWCGNKPLVSIDSEVYFPYGGNQIENCSTYMLAGPSNTHENFWNVVCLPKGKEAISASAYGITGIGLRPVVCLPKGTNLIYNKTNEIYDINQ